MKHFRALKLTQTEPIPEHEKIIEFLNNKNNIRQLTLRRFEHLDTILSTLKNLDKFESLELFDSNISDSDLLILFQNSPKIRSLKLVNCKGLMCADSLAALVSLDDLESLDLSNSDIDAKTLNAILCKTPYLRELNVQGCKHIIYGEVNASLDELESLILENISFLDLGNMSHLNIWHSLDQGLAGLIGNAFIEQLDAIELPTGTTGCDIARLRQKAPKISRVKFSIDFSKGLGMEAAKIEGTPGIGKSELVRSTLNELGFKEQKWDKKRIERIEKAYYDIPVSMPLDEKKGVLLLRAFHEGAVVVIDEINSTSLMEHLMNDLLMGKTPEKERPHQPGFMIIGTQNPPSMAGRNRIGTALSRRLMTLKLPDYSNIEIRAILNAAGMPSEKAEHLINTYQQAITHAVKNYLSPPPTFRDLWKLAKEELKIFDRIKSHTQNIEISQTNTPIDPSLIKEHQQLVNILRNLDPTDKITLIQTLNKKHIQALIKNGEQLTQILVAILDTNTNGAMLAEQRAAVIFKLGSRIIAFAKDDLAFKARLKTILEQDKLHVQRHDLYRAHYALLSYILDDKHTKSTILSGFFSKKSQKLAAALWLLSLLSEEIAYTDVAFKEHQAMCNHGNLGVLCKNHVIQAFLKPPEAKAQQKTSWFHKG